MSKLQHLSALAVVVALACGGAARAAGTVEVKFVDPDQFSDAGRGSIDIERTVKAFTEHLQGLGKALPDGQTLRLSVTDIDLAGELRPTRHGSDVRVLRGRADWPRVNLRYELMDGGRTLKSGEARLSDISYQQVSLGLYRNDAYAYEMRMLDRWFKDDIVAAKTVAARQ